ncbi:MAG: tetratricopeptide repeat protein [Byssovorax sp.]
MSRRSLPPISPTDLRDHADEARIARVWQRIEHDLTGFEAPAKRRSSLVYFAVAAAFAAFGGGLFLGKVAFHDQGAGTATLIQAPARDGLALDVLAAGTEPRTFALPGGGQLVLQPGSMVELERAEGGALTLKLLQGDASVDTASAARSAGLSIVAGDARLNTQAGSVVSVSRGQDDMDVSVRDGSVNLTTPQGSQKLGRGDKVEALPIHGPTAALSPTSTPLAPARLASRPGRPKDRRASDRPANAGPEWLEQANAGHDAEALALLKQQPGGVEGAIQGARSAIELMAIRDIALKGGEQGAANSAYERVVESFPGDQNAPLAAYQLGASYQRAGQTDRARKYFEQYLALSPSGAFAEGALCSLISIASGGGNKGEALRRSKEYVARYPNGQCKAVERDAEGTVDDEPPAASAAPSAPSAPPPDKP